MSRLGDVVGEACMQPCRRETRHRFDDRRRALQQDDESYQVDGQPEQAGPGRAPGQQEADAGQAQSRVVHGGERLDKAVRPDGGEGSALHGQEAKAQRGDRQQGVHHVHEAQRCPPPGLVRSGRCGGLQLNQRDLPLPCDLPAGIGS